MWATIEPMENSKCNLLVPRTLVDVTVKQLQKRGTEIALCGPVRASAV